MTDEELIARLRVANAYRGPDFSRPVADPIKVAAADRIEALVKEVERNAAIAIRAMERATLAEEWSKHDKSRAERLEAAIRELKRCWYQGDLTENDFAAALKGADHD